MSCHSPTLYVNNGVGPDALMTKRSIFLTLSFVANLFLVAAVLLTAYGALWEYSTRSYLRGVSDAVVPYAAAPQQKIEAILAWMSGGPPRKLPDPSRHGQLLQNCGTATFGFVKVADGSGLKARRLLLIGPGGTAI